MGRVAGASAAARNLAASGSEDAGQFHRVGPALIVALGDGIGSTATPGRASRMAVDLTVRRLNNTLEQGENEIEQTWSQVATEVVDQVSDCLSGSLGTDPAVPEAAVSSSTLCFGVILPHSRGATCWWAAIGDSGLGVIRGRSLFWLTRRDRLWTGNLGAPTDGVPYPAKTWEKGCCHLRPGDILFAATDGVTRFVHANERLSVDHLRLSPGSLTQSCAELADKCARENHDDATIMAAQVRSSRQRVEAR
jgi:serine/threonine protein phosphatase PrpC